jgi:hypothetical protein
VRSQATPRLSQATPQRPRPTASAPPEPATTRGRRRRISPLWVVLAVAVVGSIAFSLYALTIRDEAQVPMLAAGSLVVAISFGAVAVAGVYTAYRAARAGRNGTALAAALLGGVAALVAAGSLAVATVLAQIWGGTGTVS